MIESVTGYDSDVVLRDGSTLRLRPARPSDEASVRTMFARLSSASLYARFFHIPKLPHLNVSSLLGADPDRAFTLIGELHGEPCALAGYTRDPLKPDHAEIAFVTGSRFLARTPHGYTEPQRIMQDLAAAGFTTPPAIETIAFTSRAVSACIPAVAYCQGTPLRGEIESRDPAGLERATQAAQEEVARRFGEGPIEGLIQALMVTATR